MYATHQALPGDAPVVPVPGRPPEECLLQRVAGGGAQAEAEAEEAERGGRDIVRLILRGFGSSKKISAPICISLTSCASPSSSSWSKSSIAFKQAFLKASPTASRLRDSKEGGCLRQGMALKQGCGFIFNSLHYLKGGTRCVLPPSHERTALARSVLIVLKLESKSPPDEGRFFGNIARLSLRQEWGSLHCAGLSYFSSEST